MRLAALLTLTALPAAAQFQLLIADPAGDRSAPAVYDLGTGYAGDALTARFRLRNNSATPASVMTMTLGGVGFSLSAPMLPVNLEPQSSLDFAVSFRATDLGSYSAVLRAENVTILLTAAVQPRLSLRTDAVMIGDVIDFGSVARGNSVRHQFTLSNETPVVLTVPAISVTGPDFAAAGTMPAGIPLLPGQAAGFAIDYSPVATGARRGTLAVGDRIFSLSATAFDPPPPKPVLAIELGQPASAQQGRLVVNFDRPSTVFATGVATLEFRGSADPTVTFANGQRQAAFTLAPGDTRAKIPFQTGTTAGTLLFAVQLGDGSDALSVQIPTFPPALGAVQATRSAGSIQVRITGYDNTHSVSQLAFAFFDETGKELILGGIPVDLSGEFARYFGESDAGGTFLLRANFPVTGNALQIAAVEVAATDLIGTTRSARVLIQ
jgi:hypothetical protein